MAHAKAFETGVGLCVSGQGLRPGEARAMTRDVVNLNKVRKARAKADKRIKADQNAAVHGLPKAAKAEAQAKAKQAAERLSGKKRDDDAP